MQAFLSRNNCSLRRGRMILKKLVLQLWVSFFVFLTNHLQSTMIDDSIDSLIAEWTCRRNQFRLFQFSFTCFTCKVLQFKDVVNLGTSTGRIFPFLLGIDTVITSVFVVSLVLVLGFPLMSLSNNLQTISQFRFICSTEMDPSSTFFHSSLCKPQLNWMEFAVDSLEFAVDSTEFAVDPLAVPSLCF